MNANLLFVKTVRKCNIFSTLLFLVSSNVAAVNFSAIVPKNFEQAITPSISYGKNLDRSAEFIGITVNYSKMMRQNWSWATALSWDKERSDNDKAEITYVDSYTIVAAIGYLVASDVDVSIGVGKGIADNDNATKDLKFTDGDLFTGGSVGWTFWRKDNRSLNISTSLEFNLTDDERSVSVDLGYGFLF